MMNKYPILLFNGEQKNLFFTLLLELPSDPGLCGVFLPFSAGGGGPPVPLLGPPAVPLVGLGWFPLTVGGPSSTTRS